MATACRMQARGGLQAFPGALRWRPAGLRRMKKAMRLTTPRAAVRCPRGLVPSLRREGAKQMALDEPGRITCVMPAEFRAGLEPAFRVEHAAGGWLAPLVLVGLILTIASFVLWVAP